MGATRHEYGAKAVRGSVEDTDRVGPAVGDALRTALGLLKVFPTATVIRFDATQRAPRVAAKVDVYRVRLGTALPIGLGDVAEEVRGLLAAGFDGWTMPALGPDPAPLQTCEDRLPNKVAKLLDRHEFRSVEEVALVPDEALLKLGGMGPTLLAQLRAAIPPTRPRRVPAPSAADEQDSVSWTGATGLLHRMGQLTTSLSGLLAGDDPSARARAAADAESLRGELATFAATHLDPPTTSGETAAEPAVWCGNAADDGAGHRGWFVGHFLDAAAGARASEDVEVKWGQHIRGEHRDDWASGDRRSSLTLLVSGGPWRVQLPEREHTLTRPGDYLLFGPGTAHTWHADDDTIMLTLRWPSRP